MTKHNFRNKENIKFLKELASELKNQDTRFQQREVTFFQINNKKEIPAIYGCGDKEYLRINDCDYDNSVCLDVNKDINELKNEIKELIECEYGEEESKLVCKEIETEINEIDDFSDALFNLERILNRNDIEFEILDSAVVDDFQNVFLTHKACQKHIDENYHHYKEGMDTKDYAQVAWRNPEFENLIRILIEEFAD